MFNKLLYVYSKLVKKLQCPSIRESEIHKTSKIGSGSNVVRLNMGKYSYMGNYNSVMDTKIGKFCSIASYCAIGGDAHPINMVSTSPVFYNTKNVFNKSFHTCDFQEASKVIIGNDVWIGEKCFIKGGVHIGNGVIIGAHSVVTKDIPDYAIVAGAPARIIRFRFDEVTIKSLTDISWWNWDECKINAFSKYFGDPQKLIEKLQQSNL